MKISRALARRYAEALFSVLKPDEAGEALSKLGAIATAMEESENFRDLILDPTRNKREISAFLFESFGIENPKLQRFLTVLKEKKRLVGLKTVLEIFREKLNESRGIQEVFLYSALPLSEELEESIRKRLEELLKAKVDLRKYLDDSLILGLKLRIGDTIVDASFTGYLERIETEILGER